MARCSPTTMREKAGRRSCGAVDRSGREYRLHDADDLRDGLARPAPRGDPRPPGPHPPRSYLGGDLCVGVGVIGAMEREPEALNAVIIPVGTAQERWGDTAVTK